tara:strand:+ start:50 stop:433 length:384 start_codon:yes stop_codon:yes gene_type:complete
MAQINLDTASRLDIICRKGDSFSLGIDFGSAIPTSGWKMDVNTRDNASTATSIIADTVFSYAVGANSDGVSNAKITIEATAAEMNAVASGLYVYDLQNTDSGTTVDSASQVKTYLYGTFKVNADVTT